MKYTSKKKWIIGAFVSIAAIILITILFFQNEVNHVLGGNTEVVDSSQFKTLSGQLAITNVNVLSVDSESILANQTVLIKDKKIQSIGKNITIPNNYYVIDGTEQYLIPGLTDSHMHIKKSKNDFLLYIANGITQIGEMTGMKEHFKWSKEIEEGVLGPIMYIASPKITSLKGMKPMFRSWFEKRHQNYTTPGKAREAVRKFKALGYEAIKLSSDLSPEIYFAINDEAKKLNIPTIGHLPSETNLEDLYRSSQSQLAHISEIAKALERDFTKSSYIYYDNTEAYLNYVRINADSIAKKLKEKDMVVASTIWLHESLSKQDLNLPNFLKTIKLEYMNPGWVEGSIISKGWLPGNSYFENPNNTSAEDIRLSAIFWENQLETIYIIAKAMLKNGVTIIAGTDANGADGVIPGFSLHDEFESLSRVGFSNAQILQAATVAPAKWMQNKTGKIEVGYRADLILLKKNPLEDIKNTRTINTVIINGKVLVRAELDKILQSVKNANNRSRKISIDNFIN
jgi:hypothetical protein